MTRTAAAIPGIRIEYDRGSRGFDPNSFGNARPSRAAV
jgi:hypothetical protein